MWILHNVWEHHKKTWVTNWLKTTFSRTCRQYSLSTRKDVGLHSSYTLLILCPSGDTNVVFGTSQTRTWVRLNCMAFCEYYIRQTAGMNSPAVHNPFAHIFIFLMNYLKILKPHTLQNRRLQLRALFLVSVNLGLTCCPPVQDITGV